MYTLCHGEIMALNQFLAVKTFNSFIFKINSGVLNRHMNLHVTHKMKNNITSIQNVILVCTRNYLTKVDKKNVKYLKH